MSLSAAVLLSMAGPASANKFVGSDACTSCHLKQYNDFVLSGHPYKLRKAEDAKVAGVALPEGYTWDDISYVIGGRNWKSRYIDKKGYIITMTGKNRDVPGKNQFNLQTGTWSDYHPGEKNKKYNCGKCHTTGYKKEGHQDGMEGIVGTWEFPGIQCESCHGPAGKHIADVKQGKYVKGDITLDTSSSLCGKCHIRGAVDKIPASKGFIQHHEQYNEISASAKKSLSCTTCHDPHKRAELAIKVSCAQCHSKQQEQFAGSSMQLKEVKCIDCHMPRATKSAVAMGKYEGDVRTHLYKINLDPNAKMFTDDGKFANGYLTVEYACLNCHAEKDRGWALKTAKGIHSYGKK
jgi:hypothetical protein